MDSRTPDELTDETEELFEETRPARTRRPRRSPSRILGLWARLGLLALSCAILLAAAVAIVAKVIRPYQQGRELHAQVESLKTQLAEKQSENADYEHKLAYLRTPEGVVTEARKLGYVRHGEIPVVVANSPQNLEDQTVPVTAKAATPPSPVERAKNYLRSILGRRSP